MQTTDRRSARPRVRSGMRPQTKEPPAGVLEDSTAGGQEGARDDLLSHRVAPAVPSALEGLTSEFGMGSGRTPPLSSRANRIGTRQLRGVPKGVHEGVGWQ